MALTWNKSAVKMKGSREFELNETGCSVLWFALCYRPPSGEPLDGRLMGTIKLVRAQWSSLFYDITRDSVSARCVFHALVEWESVLSVFVMYL